MCEGKGSKLQNIMLLPQQNLIRIEINPLVNTLLTKRKRIKGKCLRDPFSDGLKTSGLEKFP